MTEPTPMPPSAGAPKAKTPYIIAVIPAVNEESSIAKVILKAKPHVDKVVVCDDGSRDMTANIASALGATLNNYSALYAFSWNGSVLSLKADSLTNNSGTVAYKCFDMALTSAFRPASSYEYVLKVTNLASSALEIRLAAYSSANLSRITNLTICIHDGVNSSQIIVDAGSYSLQNGSWYALAASSVDYVSVYISPCSPGTTAIYAYLEVRVPGCGVLVRYPVNFYIA